MRLYFALLSLGSSLYFIPNLGTVEAHGIVVCPKAEVVRGKEREATSFLKQVDGREIFPEYVAYDGWGSVVQNAVRFEELFNASKEINSVKQIVNAQVDGCGNTKSNGKPHKVSELECPNEIWFQNVGQAGEGFTPSHAGPCEAWIDDVKVFYNADCATNFPGSKGVVPDIDYSICKGKCVLEFYWLSLQEQLIQYYKYCIPIVGTPSTPNSVTPKPVTPEPVTPEPVTPEPVTPEPVTPEPVTPPPATTTPVTPPPTEISELPP